uniref:SusC/RagA family TonB-linked outer membrane protein n=1 Tax=uncultured Muribaculaceae bacterium TaxID=2301481 RepID=A0A6G8F3S0_9BACT|nr:SusC/RagA family TonB-linked outer membrane protein [uncultured Muribaculaceae bacterium]
MITASGIVEDAEGPLIGATVMEKGKPSNAVATDIEGRFQLKVPAGSTLVFTYVGYAQKEMKASADMTVEMSAQADLLDEVVVVGFGTQKRVNLTGSVSTVDTQLLNDRPVDNVATALQGAVPGLQINVSSGSLETDPSINIRGNGTIGSGSSGAPLVLIDGMEGDINVLNPQDVESVSVLKDAAAASIYGSRAPFGVILIKTKKGQSGKPVINYQNSFRFANLINLAHTMDSYTFATYFNDGCLNTPGWGPHFGKEWLQRIKDYRDGVINTVMVTNPNNPNYWNSPFDNPGGNANVDWYGEVFKSSNFSQEHNISVSGGTEKVNYYFSGNFSDQEGQVRWGDNDKKTYSINGRFTAQLFDWLQLGFSTRWTRVDYRRPSTLTDNLYQVLGRQGWPILPIYDDNGNFYDAPSPIAGLANGGTDKTQTDRNVNQLDLVFKPMKGWDIHAELNYSVLSATRHWDSQMIYNHTVDNQPYVYKQSSNVHEDYKKENFFNVNIFSNYDWTVADKHDFHVMLGFQTENMKKKVYGLQRDGILVPSLPQVDLTSGLGYSGDKITPSVNGGVYEWDTAGFFGRINYSYDSRYLAELNLRYDGTSRFRGDKRWIWLPSASLGWNIANEKFWEDYATVCGQLKLRASYGILGNQNIDNWYQTYRVIPLGSSNGSWLQGGMQPNTSGFPGLVSQLLTWEKVYNWNFGVDFAFFNNRLRGTAEYFIRNTKNMVGPAQELPSTLGTGVPYTNNCDLRSNGWDFEISWTDRTSFGLGYSAKFVLSDARVKVTRYPNNPSLSLNTYIEGRYINEIWGYETVGIAKTNEEMQAHLANANQSAIGSNWGAGDIMYKDLNGDGVVNSGANTLDNKGDLKLLGNSTPRWLFSLDLGADYKGFDLRVYLQGVAKRDAMINSGYFWGISGDFWWSQGLKQHTDYFRAEPSNDLPANLDSYYPRPIFGDTRNQKNQSKYMQNAAYIRLKNLQLGYTIPTNLTQKIGFQKIRIYFSGENLLTGTKLSSLFDPETFDSKNAWGGCAYPLSRTYSFGVNLTL